VRADTLSTQLLGKMKNAGVYGFAIGVESGVQSIVNKIGKRLDLNKVRYAAKMAKKYKFLLRAFFILGLPYDSFDSMRHTIRFAKEIDPHFAYFFIATLFPGTKMYDIVKEMGDIDSSTMTGDKRNPELAAHVGFYYKPVINFSFGRLKPGDVKKAYSIAVREFYMRPKKILSIISTFHSIMEMKWVFHYFLLSLFNIFSNIIDKIIQIRSRDRNHV
ncbi:MAG: B12-binding domain-containing radical SAM protein, partial [Promethearchaeota archaeon]